jgi:hypothetical protein
MATKVTLDIRHKLTCVTRAVELDCFQPLLPSLVHSTASTLHIPLQTPTLHVVATFDSIGIHRRLPHLATFMAIRGDCFRHKSLMQHCLFCHKSVMWIRLAIPLSIRVCLEMYQRYLCRQQELWLKSVLHLWKMCFPLCSIRGVAGIPKVGGTQRSSYIVGWSMLVNPSILTWKK